MLLGFEHVNFACSDLDKTLHFYCDLVGFRLVVRRNADAGGGIAFLECGDGSQLEIVQPPGDVETPTNAIPRSEVGIKHFALTVDSVDATHERLSAAGVEFTVLPRDATYQTVLSKLCVCKDPDGILVEFNERAAGRASVRAA